jgi:hypothetical protein
VLSYSPGHIDLLSAAVLAGGWGFFDCLLVAGCARRDVQGGWVSGMCHLEIGTHRVGESVTEVFTDTEDTSTITAALSRDLQSTVQLLLYLHIAL